MENEESGIGVLSRQPHPPGASCCHTGAEDPVKRQMDGWGSPLLRRLWWELRTPQGPIHEEAPVFPAERLRRRHHPHPLLVRQVIGRLPRLAVLKNCTWPHRRDAEMRGGARSYERRGGRRRRRECKRGARSCACGGWSGGRGGICPSERGSSGPGPSATAPSARPRRMDRARVADVRWWSEHPLNPSRSHLGKRTAGRRRRRVSGYPLRRLPQGISAERGNARCAAPGSDCVRECGRVRVRAWHQRGV